jgi:hypothetical protein
LVELQWAFSVLSLCFLVLQTPGLVHLGQVLGKSAISDSMRRFLAFTRHDFLSTSLLRCISQNSGTRRHLPLTPVPSSLTTALRTGWRLDAWSPTKRICIGTTIRYASSLPHTTLSPCLYVDGSCIRRAQQFDYCSLDDSTRSLLGTRLWTIYPWYMMVVALVVKVH